MKILVACEFSQIVTRAFREKGQEAYSCDILPTEGNPAWHIQDDVLKHLDKGWDLMIAHPPCTYLSYAAAGSWNDKGRIEKRLKALEFFRLLWEAPIDRICIENPKGCASPVIAKYSQIIQPYYFGDRERKATWLWLKNLPLLEHYEQDTLLGNKKTLCQKPEPSYIKPDGTPRYFNEKVGGKNRAHNRSRFWPGIAQAMVEQWSEK